MRIILPKIEATPRKAGEHLFFLAGPIRGGGDWQKEACFQVNKMVENPFIAVPCRWGPDHPLYQFGVPGKETFDRQLPWERKYIWEAARPCAEKPGCLIFWLPEESKSNPRTDGQPYARDSYGELGEWRGHLYHNSFFRVVIGAEEGFPGLDVLRRNFHSALGEKFDIWPTLRQTLQAAVIESSKPSSAS